MVKKCGGDVPFLTCCVDIPVHDRQAQIQKIMLASTLSVLTTFNSCMLSMITPVDPKLAELHATQLERSAVCYIAFNVCDSVRLIQCFANVSMTMSNFASSARVKTRDVSPLLLSDMRLTAWLKMGTGRYVHLAIVSVLKTNAAHSMRLLLTLHLKKTIC